MNITTNQILDVIYLLNDDEEAKLDQILKSNPGEWMHQIKRLHEAQKAESNSRISDVFDSMFNGTTPANLEKILDV